MDELQNEKNLLKEELKLEKNRKDNDISPKMILRFLESFVGKFEDPVLRMRVLPFIMDKIIVDDDKLAVDIFFRDYMREESIDNILNKIKAIEEYENSSVGHLDMSDEASPVCFDVLTIKTRLYIVYSRRLEADFLLSVFQTNKTIFKISIDWLI